MGIFNKLAGLFSKEEKAEEELEEQTEEKLLLAALVNLKTALKSAEKTRNEIEYVLKKSRSLKEKKSIDKLLAYFQKAVKEGIHETIISLDFTNKCLKTVKEKIEARMAVSRDYRSAAYSKDKLLLNLVEKVPDRISEVIRDLHAHEKEVKEVPTVNIMEPHSSWMSASCTVWIEDSAELFSECKRAIGMSIEDLENVLASQA